MVLIKYTFGRDPLLLCVKWSNGNFLLLNVSFYILFHYNILVDWSWNLKLTLTFASYITAKYSNISRTCYTQKRAIKKKTKNKTKQNKNKWHYCLWPPSCALIVSLLNALWRKCVFFFSSFRRIETI